MYAEIRAGIDTRSALGLHVMQHLYSYVAVHTFRRDGVVYAQDRWGGAEPVRGLYVDPASGLLRWKEKEPRKRKWPRETPKPEPWVADTDRPWRAPREYRRVNGVWYCYDYRRDSAAAEPVLVARYQCDRWTVQLIEAGAFGRLE